MDVMLSALQHDAFCPRRCALIYLEQVWEENSLTAQGRLMHETAHIGSSRMRDGIKVATDLELRCLWLGLHGRADVVEFRRGERGFEPYPVEYKKGRRLPGTDADEVQLCAQALCLEEMLATVIPEGALFYGEARHRHAVVFSDALRSRTETIVHAVRSMLLAETTPAPHLRPWCKSCSLNEHCLPELQDRKASAYVQALCREQP